MMVALAQELSGVVEPGRGLGAAVMSGADLERLSELLGFPAVPGTLNVRLPAPVVRDAGWRYLPAGEIGPRWEEATGHTGYHLVPVLVEGCYRGVAFQADEPGGPGYPADQVELICETHLRRELGLEDGDPITFSID
jgi:CTP-dependent riboflavin kinase